MKIIVDFFKKHCVFFAFLSFLLIYGIGSISVLDTWLMTHTTHVFHLVDFSMGFCSRFLPGAIYNFLFDDTGIKAVSIFNLIIYLVFLVLLALFTEKLIKKTDDKIRSAYLAALVLFFTGPTVFSMLNFERGSLDHYWIYFTTLSVICLSCKYSYIFIAVFSLMCVMTNVGSMVTYIPFIVLLMIYKTTVITNKKERNYLWTVIIGTVISCILLTLYFLIFEKSNLVYNFREFNDILKSRGYEKDESFYYSTILYSKDYYGETETEIFDYLNSKYSAPIAGIFFRIYIAFASFDIIDAVYPLILMAPVVVTIFWFIFNVFKSDKNGIKRISLFGMFGMFFVTLSAGLIFSTDTCRFIGHAYTLLFASTLYISQYEQNTVSEIFNKHKIEIPSVLKILYYLCYMVALFDPTN